MGGQACVLYGAAQFSKDIDFFLLADEENYAQLQKALDELQAHRIAVPKFDPDVLARGHAVHFRCRAEGVAGLRVDILTRLRDLSSFATLWDRRTTIDDGDGVLYEVLSVPDLVLAKKTQREKDWPMISALVENHYHKLGDEETSARIEFWLLETRITQRLTELAVRFPVQTAALVSRRPLLQLAAAENLDGLRTALDAEVRAEQARDRAYWEPLKIELEQFRREERGQ